MEPYNNEDYVLVLEDRTAIQSPDEVGQLSVISSIDKNGNLKTAEAQAAHQASFLKFSSNEGMLKNFMTNFLKQFNDPARFGLYKVLAHKFDEGLEALRVALEHRHCAESTQQLEEAGVRFEDYLPAQKHTTSIDRDRIDWQMLYHLGVNGEHLEKSGELDKMLNWQKSNLVTISIPIGNSTIVTEARLAFRTDENGDIGLAVHPIRKEPQLNYPYMGHSFTPEEKEQLLSTGNLGKTIEVTPKSGESFVAYVSIDPQTNELVALRADRVSIPQEIKGVRLSDVQYKELVEGKPIYVEGMYSKAGEPFNATLQVNAEKKGIEFIFNQSQGYKERHQQSQGQLSVPRKLCGLELSENQRKALEAGQTLHLKNMVDKEGNHFNSYVRIDPSNKRIHFYRWNPDKTRKEGKREGQATAPLKQRQEQEPQKQEKKKSRGPKR